MRKRLILTTILLSSAITLTGCMEKTGDVGNKNIRPNSINNNRTRFANDQDNEQNRMYGERRENNNIIGMHGNSHIELSDEVAEQISSLPEVDSAFVAITDHNAYVAVILDNKAMTSNSMEIPDMQKDKIADRIKSLSPSTENVYVSTNPDFVSRMQGYANVVQQGHPIQGLIVEFNALVERVFPAPSGTRAR
ncbi:YhcN/YlaJ family sporulation lipoprotein [Cohnella sp.]|uniref:YhcN/YlaJ family sporulation lipoprotein n=1 Tax=Cohnella sp. TaxID=1883426 RepID=UPI003568A462